MMPPRIEACWFRNTEPGRDAMYRRLARVLDYSARKHCPGWDVNVERLEPPPYTSALHQPSHVWNTQKLEFWRRRVLEAPDGARVLLLDGDMLVTKPLDDVWAADYELAYTIRDGGSRLPLNGGVVALRVSDSTRGFMNRWWEVNLGFLGNAKLHDNWRRKYAGINQASFGYLLEKGTGLAAVAKLRCSEWNLCEWEAHDPSASRIIHIKSSLRVRLFNPNQRPGARPRTAKIIERWLAEETECDEWQKRRAETTASSGTGPIPSTSVVG